MRRDPMSWLEKNIARARVLSTDQRSVSPLRLRAPGVSPFYQQSCGGMRGQDTDRRRVQRDGLLAAAVGRARDLGSDDRARVLDDLGVGRQPYSAQKSRRVTVTPTSHPVKPASLQQIAMRPKIRHRKLTKEKKKRWQNDLFIYK